MNIDSIDMKKLIQRNKKRLNLETKQIKKLVFYNYLNDGKPNLIIDCRKCAEENYTKDGGYLRESHNINKFNPKEILLKQDTRLILILDNPTDLKESSALENIRTFIKDCDFIDGIYTIIHDDFRNFISKNPCFIINESSENIKVQLASTSFPLQVLDGQLYVGNFLNSKNLMQLKELGIRSIISLLKEEDKELSKMFSNVYHIETDEVGHGEIDFNEAIDIIEGEIKRTNVPVLVYCFSGQTLSLALCIAYLMKTKKWALEFATAFMMKVHPNLKIPTWLYTQLQRLTFKSQ
jgi:protein tyrosine phosphatase (PTP) superfamily phosphohydrolase (DUF442 family)